MTAIEQSSLACADSSGESAVTPNYRSSGSPVCLHKYLKNHNYTVVLSLLPDYRKIGHRKDGGLAD